MPPHATERAAPRIDATTGRARNASLDVLDVFEELGERIQWVQSYVTADKPYCLSATGGALTRSRATDRRGPRDRIAEVRRMMADSTSGAAGASRGTVHAPQG